MDATQENSYFAEVDESRARGKELDARAGLIAGLLGKGNLAKVLAAWKPANGKTISELAKSIAVREEWELQSPWQRIYWAFQDAIETGKFIRLLVADSVYAVREYGTPAEYSAVLDELEKIASE